MTACKRNLDHGGSFTHVGNNQLCMTTRDVIDAGWSSLVAR
uniref:Uncharacterized protein n=1 Tax=uncultured alpha proteobacterium HF0130_06E21 TaxID=710808 RepID=E0XT17_9PROT|nr:hypothetical protein [uncultured alpha proteobacterium HF0130_06E21]